MVDVAERMGGAVCRDPSGHGQKGQGTPLQRRPSQQPSSDNAVLEGVGKGIKVLDN